MHFLCYDALQKVVFIFWFENFKQLNKYWNFIHMYVAKYIRYLNILILRNLNVSCSDETLKKIPWTSQKLPNSANYCFKWRVVSFYFIIWDHKERTERLMAETKLQCCQGQRELDILFSHQFYAVQILSLIRTWLMLACSEISSSLHNYFNSNKIYHFKMNTNRLRTEHKKGIYIPGTKERDCFTSR